MAEKISWHPRIQTGAGPYSCPQIDIPKNQTKNVARPNCMTAIFCSLDGVNKIRCATETVRTKKTILDDLFFCDSNRVRLRLNRMISRPAKIVGTIRELNHPQEQQQRQRKKHISRSNDFLHTGPRSREEPTLRLSLGLFVNNAQTSRA